MLFIVTFWVLNLLNLILRFQFRIGLSDFLLVGLNESNLYSSCPPWRLLLEEAGLGPTLYWHGKWLQTFITNEAAIFTECFCFASMPLWPSCMAYKSSFVLRNLFVNFTCCFVPLFISLDFSRPHWRSRLCYSVASVAVVCDGMYCG